VWIRCVRCEKFQRDVVERTFVLIAQVRSILHQVSFSNEMIPDSTKHTKT
jgi:hypothetical protein